jgi:hypothetical protein
MDVSGRGIIAVIHFGADCLQVIRRSVRSCERVSKEMWVRGFWETYDSC